MRKRQLFSTLLVLFFSSAVFASAEKFYDMNKLQYLRGESLKTALHNLVEKSHESRSYKQLYNAFLESDIDREYEGDGSVIDIYSERPSQSDPYNYFNRGDTCGQYRGEGQCFNREHIFPQGAFGKRSPMKSDFFHLYPTDGYVNNIRGSLVFGEVREAEYTSKNGSKMGSSVNADYRRDVFEPIDEFKGDVARALLYFAIRYEDRVRSFRHDLLDGSTFQVYRGWILKTLIKWHKLDPVSAWEIRRNDVGEDFQGNRNPLIDHPEFVSQIWE